MKKKKVSTEPDLDIDKNNLDSEWVRQPKLVGYYGKMQADAKQELERAKTAYDVKEAELDKKMRKRPDRYGIEKGTEKEIEKALIIEIAKTQEYKDWLSAKHKVDILFVTMTKLEHRKKALEDLVYLWSAAYFGEPRNKHGLDRNDLEDMKERKIYNKAVRKGKRLSR